jgi:hypothetical protein
MTVHNNTLNTRVRYGVITAPLKRKPNKSFRAMLIRGLKNGTA